MTKYLHLLLVLIFLSCKDDTIETKNPVKTNDPIAATDTSSTVDIEIYENVSVITAENSNIVSTEAELESGIYAIEFTSEVPNLAINDILVGDGGEGFLRKIQTINTDGNTLTIQTEQATFEDLFKKASFSFSTDISDNARFPNASSETFVVNYLAEGVSISEDGLSYDFSNTVLFEKDPLKFEITKGSAKFDPKINFDSDFGLFGMTYANFESRNASLDIDVDLSLKAEGKVELPEFKKKLVEFSKTRTITVGIVPVVVTVKTVLEAELKASVDAEFDLTSGFTNNYPFSTEVKYENSNWSGVLDVNPTFKTKPIDMAGKVKLVQNLTITPTVSIKFYGIIGPYLEPKMTEDFAFAIASPSLDWDSNLKVGLNVTGGIKAEILGKKFDDFKTNKEFSKELWKAPDSLRIISGNKQKGTLGKELKESIKVRVSDNLGNPMPIVPVYFKIKEGEGSVGNDSVIITNENGIAEAFWTLGTKLSSQKLEATYKNSEGKTNDNKALFTATANEIQVNFEIASGNGQEGKPGELLSEPIKIKATDSLGSPVVGIPVYFIVETGGGTINEVMVNTNAEGFAQVEWTLGDESDEQTVEASIRKADGETVASTLTFEAITLNITISLTGDLNFGEVNIDELAKRSLFIENLSMDEMNVSSIDWPEGFSGNWSMGIIKPGETKEVEVTFAPMEAKGFAGEAIVQIDLYDENNSISLSGTGLEPINLQSGVWVWENCDEECSSLTFIFNEDGSVTIGDDFYYDYTGTTSLKSTYTLEGENLTMYWTFRLPYIPPSDTPPGCGGAQYNGVYVFNMVLKSENIYGGTVTFRLDGIGGTADCMTLDGAEVELGYSEIYKTDDIQARKIRTSINKGQSVNSIFKMIQAKMGQKR
jgi:hypothetical protein